MIFRNRTPRRPVLARHLGAGLVLLELMAPPRAAFSSEPDPKPTITILIYNLAKAPSAILNGAEREAGRIFVQAGVRTSWFDCTMVHTDTHSHDICEKGWEPILIELRILIKPTERGERFQGERYGFAIIPGLASVYYDHKARFISDDFGMGLSLVLGCVMAHEIGHLLLGPNSHSSQGVMQGEWNQRQLRQALMKDLLFSREESELIQEEVQRRMRLEEGPTQSVSSTPE